MTRAYKNAKWQRLLTMDADIIHVPDSHNRFGTDPWPEFFIRLNKLVSYQKVSFNSSSANNGYIKSEDGPFYVKNIRELDPDIVGIQFQLVKDSPPYGFTTEGEYEDFIRTTFEPSYFSALKSLYYSKPLANRKYVSVQEDPSIGKGYYKTATTERTIEEFYSKKYINIAAPKDYEVITA